MGIDYDMDTAEQERVEDADLDWTRDLCSFLNGQHKIYVQAGRTKEARRLREYVEKLARLRARQREEGDDFDPSMLDVLEEAAQKLTKRPAGEHGPLLMGLDRIKGAIRGHLDATPQREGEREPVATTSRYQLQTGINAVLDARDLYSYREALTQIQGMVERELDRHTEPPAELDLDELTPRCPACEETMHDCECNPYMGTGGDDG